MEYRTDSMMTLQTISWNIAATLRFSVTRTRPRAIPLAMITMKKSINGLLFLSCIGLRLRLAALWTTGALLLNN